MIKRIKTAILFLFISIFLIFLFQFPICAQESTTQNACYYKLPGDYRLPFVGLTSFSTNSWLHKGSDEFAIDFPLTYGQWVFASNRGTVIFAGDSDYGNLVKIKHPDGLISYYAHLSKIFVKVGDYVLQEYPIGEVGNTGKYSTGTHLHFHVEDELDNPIYLLDSLPGMPNSESPTYSCPLPGYAIGPPLDVTFCTLPSYIIAAASSPSGEVLGVAEVSKVSIPAPSKPSLTSPYNWYQSLGTPPMLMWNGDNNSTYYYVVANSSNTGNVESGWINSTSWKPNLPNQNYIYSWKVKAKNSQGVESPWSDESHFSIASTTLKFEGDISFSPSSPSSADMIKIFASTTGWGGVGITLRVSVNTAPDGSANGEWKILKELGVPKFNENDAPEWHTNGWSNGTYRIRVEAKGPNDPYWQNPAIIETTYTLIDKTIEPEATSPESTVAVDLGSLLLNEDFSSNSLDFWNTVGDVSIYNDGGNPVVKCVATQQQYTDMYYHFYIQSSSNQQIMINSLGTVNYSCRVKAVDFKSGEIGIYAAFITENGENVGAFSKRISAGGLPIGSWKTITFSQNLSGYPEFDLIILGATTNTPSDIVVYFDDFRIY